MMHSRSVKMYRTYLGRFYGFGNIAVDVSELRFGDLHIHTTEYVYSGRNRLPAESHIFRYIKIKVLIDSLKCLFRTSYGISLVDLIEFIISGIQITVSVNTCKFYLGSGKIYIGYHYNVGVITLTYSRIS